MALKTICMDSRVVVHSKSKERSKWHFTWIDGIFNPVVGFQEEFEDYCTLNPQIGVKSLVFRKALSFHCGYSIYIFMNVGEVLTVKQHQTCIIYDLYNHSILGMTWNFDNKNDSIFSWNFRKFLPFFIKGVHRTLVLLLSLPYFHIHLYSLLFRNEPCLWWRLMIIFVYL